MDMVIYMPLVLAAAFVLDYFVGDPEWLPHPVRWMGRLATFIEAQVRKRTSTPDGLRVGGVVLTVAVVAAAYVVTAVAIAVAARLSTLLAFALSVYFVWTGLAVRALGDSARAVVMALEGEGLDAARDRVGRIVGRDTSGLDRSGVLRAAAETVSENTSDGVVAPLFYLAIGGPPLMLAYKAVNTCDSMVGYKNDRYRYLGWFSARVDDIANFLPARVTALLLVVVSMVLGHDWRGALKVLFRDGGKHASPNAGWPEAAVAGSLHVRFGGNATYGGVVVEKPEIGEGPVKLDTASVLDTVRLMSFASAFMAGAVALVWLISGGVLPL